MGNQSSNGTGWLETVEGDAPILLIAPHGGRAGAAARATLHPKVNDLETAEITRELARRLGAQALVNAGMDRNEIDCNRIAQVAAQAPWILELIAERVAEIVARHGRATVLLIHGWNVIEPRVDLGLGLREAAGRLRPPAGAWVSASDDFIGGPVTELANALRGERIVPSFGLRYPGGGAQNLLQAFTPRFRTSEHRALQQLGEIAAAGLIDALQLEMSVALRLPGEFRVRNLEAISKTFGQPSANGSSAHPITVEIVREPRPHPARKVTKDASAPPLVRIGIEFYDQAARLGGMASFDFGSGAAGARIMVLFEGQRVALFTGEGRATLNDSRVSLGPLSFDAAPGGELSFHGPAVVVDDGSAYLSVEHALARSRLDDAMDVGATLELEPGARPLAEIIGQATNLSAQAEGAADVRAASPPALFGRLRGTIAVLGAKRTLDAVARIGLSFIGLGAQIFDARRMLWIFRGDRNEPRAVELRNVTVQGQHTPVARVLGNGGWRDCELGSLELEASSPRLAPERIAARLSTADGEVEIVGEADTFMTLSRPGANGVRIHTSIGFARFRLTQEGIYLDEGGGDCAGMFEYSRCVGAVGEASDEDDSE